VALSDFVRPIYKLCASLSENLRLKEHLKMKKIITIIILIFSVNAFSQELKETNWILKLNTTQLIDAFSYPTLQLSLERKINPYFSINAEVGYQLYDFKEADTIFLKPRGFKTNIEGRIYPFKLINKRAKSNRGELYIGVQLFYRANQSTNVVDYSPISDSTKLYRDYFGTKRTAKGFNITIGSQISISKKIILEPFIGFGLLNRSIKNSEIQYNPNKDFRGGTDLVPHFQGLNLEESSGSLFNFCTGFRIGYRL
jgi:hypothetical protein